MRELTPIEKNIVSHIDSLEIVTIWNILNKEFPGEKLEIEESDERVNLICYKKNEAPAKLHLLPVLKASTKLSEALKYCEVCINTINLLVDHGYLLKDRNRPELFRNNLYYPYNQRIKDKEKAVDDSYLKVRKAIPADLVTDLARLYESSFIKSSKLTNFVKYGYVTQEEIGQRRNFNIAVAALVLSTFFSLADFVRNLLEGKEPLQFKILIVLFTTILSAALINYFFNRKAS